MEGCSFGAWTSTDFWSCLFDWVICSLWFLGTDALAALAGEQRWFGCRRLRGQARGTAHGT
jgi:hypothetical protein